MEILDYVNGKTSNHLLTVLLGMIIGAIFSFFQYQLTDGISDPFASFLLMTAVSLTIAALSGWIVSLIFKNETLLLSIANWMLIIGVFLFAISTASFLSNMTVA